MIRNTNIEDNEIISSDDLFKRKGLKVDDINYNTQEKEGNNFEYRMQGIDLERRPSNAMQTQTLILPYSERLESNFHQNNVEDLDEEVNPTPVNQSFNDNKVDHWFHSEEDKQEHKERGDKGITNKEDKEDKEDKEEQKVRLFFNYLGDNHAPIITESR